MENPIYYLVFVSAATRLYNDAELVSLLSKCRANNAKNGITGLLLYHEGNFIEIIEGAQETVERVYNEKIVGDQRHHHMVKLKTGTTAERSFPGWSMGFQRATKEILEEQLPEFNIILEARQKPENVYPELSDTLLTFLQTFYRTSGLSESSLGLS
jgi:hypothetical protein